MKVFNMLLILVILISCQKENKTQKTIEAIVIDVSIDRFDRKFAAAKIADLENLKNEYPFLFPKQFSDSLWISQLNDTLQIALNNEIDNQFPDPINEKIEIEKLLQHIRYYFPDKSIPEKVITVTSNVDYKNKVIYTDDFIFISLDTYFGQDHEFYGGIQEYIRKNMNRKMIVSDVASAFIKPLIRFPESRSFLASMIYHGKELYLKDVLIPFIEDVSKIGFTNQEYAWAKANESEVWRYFIERDLLFSTDSKLQERFIKEAPFSKFYLELDAESPGRIGQYIGWQIVQSYMDNNNVSLQELIDTPYDVIFNDAKFKPKK